MIAKTRKPISVLLAVLMMVGLFASIPFTASAAPPGGGSHTITIYANNGTD